MSTPLHRRPPLEVRERTACMCRTGGRCSSSAPGHALHLIQERLAAATPSGWADAFVTAVDPVAGDLVVRTLDGTTHALWNGSGAALEAGLGSPVALHLEYGVLAVGRTRFNVAAV
ncbi:hypothetical protein [Zhihengliuella sp. ISTPL4]|uniref:hypothetical protein n=1 Tax=Zhihengliuella sp. ISTPL4 TaxID=2058657 RepID=UPI0018F1A2A9|nr:hypothetical protein [Zhihengliuella sp. ISTPL4]